MSYEYAGTHFDTIRQAAENCADGMLPDASVIGQDEDAREAAEELVNFWEREGAREGWRESGCLADVAFKTAVIDAVEARILASR